jgi:hypothetical protein
MRFLIAALLLAAACSSNSPPRHTRVERVLGQDGGWVFPISDTEGVVLDATGEKVTLVYSDKTFVVEQFKEFEGVLAEHEVILAGTFKRLHVTPDRAKLTERQKDHVLALSDITEDHQAVYRKGKWVVEKVED